MTEQLTSRDAALTGEDPGSRRGKLKVYLGSAPGTGKTYAMLREGRQLKSRGVDVVAGFVETYDRPRTIEAIGDLEVLPRVQLGYRGTMLDDLDLGALLARHPGVALIDELAHTNVPGMDHEKRWQDVEQIRDAGIDVITTLNVQHLESVKDVVEHITGIVVRETVPDSVLDAATDIQFVDISPEALRKRMSHGNIYRGDRIDAALSNFFRPGNLAALREIALRMVATALSDRAGVQSVPEDVLVAISGAPSSERLIRRGLRLARRRHGICMVVMVAQPGLAPVIEIYQDLAAKLGCSFSTLSGSNVADEIARAAREANATHVVLGESLENVGMARWRKTRVDHVIDLLPDCDIHVIARIDEQMAEFRRPDPDDLVRKQPRNRRADAHLRLYMGYAAGCGTTTAMLDEARRRASRGTDVVVAAAATHGIPLSPQLETIGGPLPGVATDRVDVEAVLRRNPEVVCIDDIAALDTSGRQRIEDVERLIDAGITVIGTLRLTDLATVRESGVLKGRQLGAPVDDDELRLAAEVELVDATPEVLLERLRAGQIFPPAEVAQAMQAEFRIRILSALREGAFRLIAAHTDRRLKNYMHDRHIEEPWEARTRIVVCVPARAGMAERIRVSARMGAALDAEVNVLSVRTGKLSDAEKQALGEYAELTHQLGGNFITVYGSKVAEAVAAHVRETLATEVVLGHRTQRWRPWDTTSKLIRILSEVDIHILRAAVEPARFPSEPMREGMTARAADSASRGS
jgi:two-component system, OmpR family, sensor histidine kinase KdpD